MKDTKKYLLRMPPDLHARLIAAKERGLSINQFIVAMLNKALNVDAKKVYCLYCKYLERGVTTDFCNAKKGIITYPDSWLGPGRTVTCDRVCPPMDKNRLNNCKDFEKIL
jgi:hypothetical protein